MPREGRSRRIGRYQYMMSQRYVESIFDGRQGDEETWFRGGGLAFTARRLGAVIETEDIAWGSTMTSGKRSIHDGLTLRTIHSL